MIAITGAAGFIGSHLAHRLDNMGHELLLVDGDISPAKAENLVGLARHRFVHQDEFLDRLGADIKRLDAIFHLGACSSTTETNWDFLRRNNLEYTKRLWSWSATSGCPFLYASSAATYGDGSLGFDDRTPPTALHPLNLYGKSKNDFDIWALEQSALSAPPVWAGVKFFNVYGARERHKGRMASVVWHAFGQIRQTGAVRLFRSTHPNFADGGQQRDFVYVEDCIDHLLWLWRHPHNGGLFNSGAGAPRSFLDLAMPYSPRSAKRRLFTSSTCRLILRANIKAIPAQRCRSCAARVTIIQQPRSKAVLPHASQSGAGPWAPRRREKVHEPGSKQFIQFPRILYQFGSLTPLS